MLDTVKQFLVDNTTPELTDSIKAAHDILERINYPDLDATFESIIVMADDNDAGSTMDQIFDTAHTLLENVLRQHAVNVSYDASLDILIKMVETIVIVEDFEDKQAIIDLCLMDRGPAEITAEILALVSGSAVEEFVTAIDYVSPALVERIGKLMQASPLPDSDDKAVQELRQKLLNNHRYFVNQQMGQPLLVTDMLKDGVAVGYPFAVYIEQIGRGLEGMLPLRAAQELVAMAIISRDASDNPRLAITNNLEHFVASPAYATKILIEVDALLTQYKP